MKRTFGILIILTLANAALADGERGRRISDRRDHQPPKVTLFAPQVAPHTFPVRVEARDESGISKVFVSVNGRIRDGRIQRPYHFTLTVDRFPVEVCAVADDRQGNSSRSCRVVRAPEPPDCFENATCADDQFCLKQPGDCPGLGECTLRPDACPAVWQPVCGCDGQTYGNECEAHHAGVSLVDAGECPPMACSSNADCLDTEMCQRPTGLCDASGACIPRPEICPDIWLPVCGCDGQTHGNECDASAAGISVAATGECP